MPIYNNPAIGQAFSNIASMFAPPSGADLAGYAASRNTNLKSQAYETAMKIYGNPNASRDQQDSAGILAGLFAPTQSYHAVDLDDATKRYGVDVDAATARRGQDVTANTTLATNAADNQRQTITSLYGPLDQGQIRPAVPTEIAAKVDLPAISEATGAPKPLSETEWTAAQNERLRQSGKLPDDVLLNALAGKETPVEIVGPKGQPQFASPGAAVRAGAEPYRPQDVKDLVEGTAVVDGQSVQVFRAPTDSTYRLADGRPLPANVQVYEKAKPTGTNADLGMKPPTERDSVIALTGENIAPGLAILNRAYSGDESISQGALLSKSIFGDDPAVKDMAQRLGIINPTDQAIMNGINSVMNYLYLQTGAARSPGEDARGYNDLVPLSSDTPETRQLKRDGFNQKALSIISQARSPELRQKLTDAMQGLFKSPVKNGEQGATGADPLGKARDAIARGADKAAVFERLRQHGINPEGL